MGGCGCEDGCEGGCEGGCGSGGEDGCDVDGGGKSTAALSEGWL